MSTTTMAPVTGGRAVLAGIRAESLRLRKWPAVWVTVGAWLLLNAMFGYVFNYVTYTSGDSTFRNEGQSRAQILADLLPAALPHSLPQGMPMFGGALMMVLGAIVAGNGFGWGTWKTVFTQGSSRTTTVLGSLSTLALVVIGVVTATLVADLGMSLGVTALQSQALVWPDLGDLVRSYGVALLVMEMWALAGYLLGVLAKGPALSVGLGLTWALVIENLLRGVGAALSWVEAFTHFLPGTAAGSLVGSLPGASGVGSAPGILDSLSPERALVTVVAYVVLLPLVALTLMRRRDVA